jgi:putative N6-adenine-specific DNA methylase
MNHLTLFLPCASGVEPYLVQEAALILGRKEGITAQSAGVQIQGSWRDSLLLNLHSRLASRVLIQVQGGNYRNEQDIYQAACDVAWEIWFTPRHTFKIDITATRSPLQSLNFAALRVKDAICDRFRHLTGERPSVDVQRPDARIYVHLGADELFLYVDTSGEPLFKRGWRQDKGEAPLKETLAAAMLAASGWWNLELNERELQPLYDPCCGSGTIAIEAAQIALGIPAGSQRHFGFERLIPFQSHVWDAMKSGAITAVSMRTKGQNSLKNPFIYGSDVAHRMADFAQRNAQLAGVSEAIEFRGGDALQRKPPCELPPQGAMILTNPPYGERIEVAGFAGRPSSEQSHPRARSRETAEFNAGDGDFFPQLAAHWKTHFDGWTAWLLVPDMKLPSKMRLKETRRVPLWNGPIECRLFRFDIQGRRNPPTSPPHPAP